MRRRETDVIAGIGGATVRFMRAKRKGPVKTKTERAGSKEMAKIITVNRETLVVVVVRLYSPSTRSNAHSVQQDGNHLIKQHSLYDHLKSSRINSN